MKPYIHPDRITQRTFPPWAEVLEVCSNRNKIHFFIWIRNLQFLVCRHTKGPLSISLRSISFWVYTTPLWPQSIRAHRLSAGGSPATSCWAGTLTVGAHRPWNICLFREGFLFAFNRAVNCLSVLWSRDHRHSDTSFISPSALTLTFLRPSTPPDEIGYRK